MGGDSSRQRAAFCLQVDCTVLCQGLGNSGLSSSVLASLFSLQKLHCILSKAAEQCPAYKFTKLWLPPGVGGRVFEWCLHTGPPPPPGQQVNPWCSSYPAPGPPEAQKAAVALDCRVGHFSDPPEVPGLARAAQESRNLSGWG